jgi:hypothetical protein
MGGGGVGRLATVRRWFRTVVTDVCLFFNVAVVLLHRVSLSCLLSPVGDWHEKRQGAPNTIFLLIIHQY